MSDDPFAKENIWEDDAVNPAGPPQSGTARIKSGIRQAGAAIGKGLSGMQFTINMSEGGGGGGATYVRQQQTPTEMKNEAFNKVAAPLDRALQKGAYGGNAGIQGYYKHTPHGFGARDPYREPKVAQPQKEETVTKGQAGNVPTLPTVPKVENPPVVPTVPGTPVVPRVPGMPLGPPQPGGPSAPSNRVATKPPPFKGPKYTGRGGKEDLGFGNSDQHPNFKDPIESTIPSWLK